MRYVLIYEYVADVAERRPPLRPAHLSVLEELHAGGHMLMCGPYNDPPPGALFIFADLVSAEHFVTVDPYVSGGLVLSHQIREWNVVVGG